MAPRYTRRVPLPTSPDDYFFAFEADDCVFIGMDRAAYRQSIFLDRRISTVAEVPTRQPIAALLPPPAAAGIGWIFHIAHCGSTLLARALDRPGGSLVLREPMALRQLGVIAGNGGDIQPRLDLATALLARRYDAALPTIIKANVPVNLLLPALAGDNPAIFLHFPLVPYLLAILRSPTHRQWLRFVTDELRPGLTALAGPLPDEDAGPLPDDDATLAAALWLAQMRAFTAAMARMPNSHSLDAETLFTAPGPVLHAATALFGQAATSAEIDAITGGPLFSTYAKNPGLAFDNAARTAREVELAASLAPELAAARQWLMPRLAAAPLPARLPRPLVPGANGRDLL